MLNQYIDRWVIAQFALIAAIAIVTPFTRIHLPLWLWWLGFIVLLEGVGMFHIAVFNLGWNATMAVTPKEDGELIETGLYGIVRHPMYGGAIMIALGWSLFWGTWAGLLLSIVLIFFLNAKAEAEEELLLKKFPAYEIYKKRVIKKLIPYVY